MVWTAVVGVGAIVLATACQADASVEPQVVTQSTTSNEPESHGDSGSARSQDAPGTAAPTPRLEGSDDWRMTRSAEDGQIEAYTSRVSAPPGTPLELKVSTSERAFRMSAYRLGDYDGGTGRLVHESEPVRGERQADAVFQPAETRTVVAPWHVSLTADTTGWEPGFYVLRLRTTSGWEYQVPYIVSSPSAAGTIAVVVPVTTWQAYNLWGGYSLYDGPSGDRRSWAVSFDRPYHGVGGMNDFHTAVVPIVVRAELSGEPLSYFANVDLHDDHDLLSGALGYVSTGHDEYWTPSMRSDRRDRTRRRHQPGVPRCQHDVLAGPPGRPADRAAPADDGLPARRRARSAPRRAAGRGDVHVPGRACARSRERADRDALRVLPGGRRLRRRLAEVVGVRGHRCHATARRSPGWSAASPTGSTPTGPRPDRCSC